MAYTNLTNITDADTYLEVAEATNNITGGLLSNVILFCIFLLILMVFKNQDIKKVLVADFFVISVIATYFFFVGFIAWYVLIICLVGLIASIIILFSSR